MKGVITLGNTLIERRACDGNEETMKVGPAHNGFWATKAHEEKSFILFQCFHV